MSETETPTVKRTQVLSVRNRHLADAPDLGRTGPDGRYISYFENALGEQCVFIREAGAKTATLYMGDMGWEPIEVKWRSSAELEDMLIAQGVDPKQMGFFRGKMHPLIGPWIIGDAEIAWVINCWFTSNKQAWDDVDIEAEGYAFGKQNWHPNLNLHPNSAKYRSTMQAAMCVAGFEMGKLGMHMRDSTTYLNGMYRAFEEMGED